MPGKFEQATGATTTEREAPALEAGQESQASPEQRVGQIQEQVGGIHARLKAVEAKLASFEASEETTEEEANLEREAQALGAVMERLQQQAANLDPSDADKPAIESTELDQLGKTLDELYAEEPTDEITEQIKVVEARMSELYNAEPVQRAPDTLTQEEMDRHEHQAVTADLAEQGRSLLEEDEKTPAQMMDDLGTKLNDLYAQPVTPETTAEIDRLQSRMSQRYQKEGFVRQPDTNVVPPDELERRRHEKRTAVLAEQGRAEMAGDEQKKRRAPFEALVRAAQEAVTQVQNAYDKRVGQAGAVRERVRLAEERLAQTSRALEDAQKKFQATADRLVTETQLADDDMERSLRGNESSVQDAEYKRSQFLGEVQTYEVVRGSTRQQILEGRVRDQLTRKLEELNQTYQTHLAKKPQVKWGIFGRAELKKWEEQKRMMEDSAGNISHRLRQAEDLREGILKTYNELSQGAATAHQMYDQAKAVQLQRKNQRLLPILQQMTALETQVRDGKKALGPQQEMLGQEKQLLESVILNMNETAQILETRKAELEKATHALEAVDAPRTVEKKSEAA